MVDGRAASHSVARVPQGGTAAARPPGHQIINVGPGQFPRRVDFRLRSGKSARFEVVEIEHAARSLRSSASADALEVRQHPARKKSPGHSGGGRVALRSGPTRLGRARPARALLPAHHLPQPCHSSTMHIEEVIIDGFKSYATRTVVSGACSGRARGDGARSVPCAVAQRCAATTARVSNAAALVSPPAPPTPTPPLPPPPPPPRQTRRRSSHPARPSAQAGTRPSTPSPGSTGRASRTLWTA